MASRGKDSNLDQIYEIKRFVLQIFDKKKVVFIPEWHVNAFKDDITAHSVPKRVELSQPDGLNWTLFNFVNGLLLFKLCFCLQGDQLNMAAFF